MADTIAPAAKAEHPLTVFRTELVWEGKFDSAATFEDESCPNETD
jgi:hypothetical protein